MPIRGDGMHRENCIDWAAWRMATARAMEHNRSAYASWELDDARHTYFEWLNTFKGAWPDMWATPETASATRLQIIQRSHELMPEVEQWLSRR